jgi:hypothetical protein
MHTSGPRIPVEPVRPRITGSMPRTPNWGTLAELANRSALFCCPSCGRRRVPCFRQDLSIPAKA